MRVSLRSIEPLNYSIVDMNHPSQGGRNDGVHDKAAVIDTIPYSRVFYHAYPGAIIMHRGTKYKIHSISQPPTNFSIGCQYNNLGAFAQPTTARYTTRALSINHITVVKQLNRVEVSKSTKLKVKEFFQCENDHNESLSRVAADTTLKQQQVEVFNPELTFGCIAGNGVVNVKKTVHGYAKLSLVNRSELSRTEISVPPMEYDTNGLWIDAEASVLREVMIDYDSGVHALAHAILAVSPLFVPCTSSDIDCDHSRFGCTCVLLFDVRAGGGGATSQLWKHFFKPDGVLDAVIDLLSECPNDCEKKTYKGGCPGCIQGVPCINFHENLSRPAGLYIARRMLARLKQSSLYNNCCNTKKQMIAKHEDSSIRPSEVLSNKSAGRSVPSPRRVKRQRALYKAADLVSARNRNIVVGRPTWPTDEATSYSMDAD